MSSLTSTMPMRSCNSISTSTSFHWNNTSTTGNLKMTNQEAQGSSKPAGNYSNVVPSVRALGKPSYASYCKPTLAMNDVIQYINRSCFYVLREGLEWTDIDWVDNGECLDLIEKVSSTLSGLSIS